MKRNNDDQATTSSTPTEYEPREKRTRRTPARFQVQMRDPLRTNCFSSKLANELKSWDNIQLKCWSDFVQWNWDATNEDISSITGKDPESVEALRRLILAREWKSTASKDLGSGMLINKTDDDSSRHERPLDSWFRKKFPPWKIQFWHQLTSLLTPDKINHSFELSSVMKKLAENATPIYGPIYEYLAIIMDDPVATINMNPKLTGLQAGIILEIIHSIGLMVKKLDTSDVNTILRGRALAVLKGDWETLKMPILEDPQSPIPQNLMKRASLQSLNPFAMPRSTIPKVKNVPPKDQRSKYQRHPTSLNVTRLPAGKSLNSYTKCSANEGQWKTKVVVHDIPRLDIRHSLDPLPEAEETSQRLKQKIKRGRSMPNII